MNAILCCSKGKFSIGYCSRTQQVVVVVLTTFPNVYKEYDLDLKLKRIPDER
ncbi:uncharacterized protein ASCRUDRAFT_144821 [Ascoidea rubescens DSM 1968]|uniref:Uncharacterized protein n=1 Tax=Ascoidea rubescens DSM 1968 TaxID=1344418 RepID=A0A1D2VH07_9ASCO|nr:hypothetical protein ASCRUDRAFT_144821 [Ascoidea rubescens DSM 1968]ODV60951.1 hypothetical protein ASCRUDRAFT_144821 [Ascoidea rubescens DSM 1968]